MANSNNKTRRERLEEREGAILAAAHDEFVRHGFEGAKIAAIAKRAGVAEGTLYLYFRNKQALLAAVVGAFYARLTEGAADGVSGQTSTDERLAFLAWHHLQSCLDEWALLALAVPMLFTGEDYRGSEYFGFNRAYVAVFDGVVREGIARGDLRDDLPLHLLRDGFYGSLEHSVRTAMVRESATAQPLEAEALAEQVMAMIRPAFGLCRQATEAPGESMADLAQRFERVASRLEQVAGRR